MRSISRQKEADSKLQISKVKSYLDQYQIAEQNIRGLLKMPQTEYVKARIRECRAIQIKIEQLFARMPMNQKKTVLEMHYIGGRTFNAIVTDLNIAPSTVQKYHKLGLQKVAEMLKREGIK